MDPSMFDGIAKLFPFLCFLAAIGMILGCYELIRLLIWLCNHVAIV